MDAVYEKLVEQAARAICARTNIARPDVIEVIFDQPDDLVWVTRQGVQCLAPRWTLYQERARAAMAAAGTSQMWEVLAAVLHQIERARAPNTLLAALALDEIERLVSGILKGTGTHHRSHM